MRRGRMMVETEMAEVDDAYARFYPGVATGRYAVLSVSDTGMGMDAETRERIFEPFFTAKEKGRDRDGARDRLRHRSAARRFHSRLACSP
jgi:signal transduction histidine kinase